MKLEQWALYGTITLLVADCVAALALGKLLTPKKGSKRYEHISETEN